MPDFRSASRLLVTPMGLCVLLDEEYAGKTTWIPVCRYPVGYDVEKQEAGMLAVTGRDDEIKEIKRRVFVHA